MGAIDVRGHARLTGAASQTITEATVSTGGSGAVAAGDVLYVLLAGKPSSTAPVNSAGGATLLMSVNVGTGTDGVDTGLLRLTLYKFAITGTTFSLAFTQAGTGAVLAAGVIAVRPSSNEGITERWVSGSDTSSDTSFSVTATSGLVLNVDELITVLGAGTVNSALSNLSIQATNASLDTQSSPGGTGSNVGNHSYIWSGRKPVLSSTGATSVPSVTGTFAAASSGGALFLVIRSALLSIQRSGSVMATGTGSASQAVAQPAQAQRSGSVMATGTGSGSQVTVAPAVYARSGSVIGDPTTGANQRVQDSYPRSGSVMGDPTTGASRTVTPAPSPQRSGSMVGEGTGSAGQRSEVPRAGSVVGTGTGSASQAVTQPPQAQRSGQTTGEGTLTGAQRSQVSRTGSMLGEGTGSAGQSVTAAPTPQRSGSVLGTAVGSAGQRTWVPRTGATSGTGVVAGSVTVVLAPVYIRSGSDVVTAVLSGSQQTWVLRSGGIAGTGVSMGAEVVILPPSPQRTATILGRGVLGGMVETDISTRYLPRYTMPTRRPAVRWLAQDILTGEWVSTDLNVGDPTVTLALSTPTTLEFELEAGLLARLGLKPWGTFVHVETDGAIRASGVLMPWSWGGSAVPLTARGVSAYPAGMPFGATSALAGDSGLVGVGLDPLDVVRYIWEYLQSQPDGDLGVILDATKSLVRIGTMTDETQYDAVDPNTGAAAPSVVSNEPLDPRISRIRYLAQQISADARTLQSDLGLPTDTLVLIDNDAQYIIGLAGQAISEDPGRYGTGKIATLDTHRNGPYSALNWWENTDCGQEIDTLAKDSPFDYLETPTWSDDGESVVQRIRLGWPRLGRRPTGVEFTEGVNLTEALTPVERDDDYASEITVLGKGEGPTMIRGTAGVPRAGRLRRAFVVQDSGISTGDGASRRAELERLRKQGLTSFTSAKVRLTHSASRLGSFRPGDDVPVRCSVRGLGDVSILHRVDSIAWKPGTDYADVALTRSDTLRYGGEEIQ